MCQSASKRFAMKQSVLTWMFILTLMVWQWGGAGILRAQADICDEEGLRRAVAAGGTVTLNCDQAIELRDTIVIPEDLEVTIESAPRVSVITSDRLRPKRLFRVEGTLTLRGLQLINAADGGSAGIDGRLGSSGMAGANGANGGPGMNGRPGEDGGDGEDPSEAGSGSDGQGGALYIAESGNVTIMNCQFSGHTAVGGFGGDGLPGFREPCCSQGGRGGLGGNGGNGSPGNGGNGGDGGNAGMSIDQPAGGEGGKGQGGAIYNAGTLVIRGSMFNSNRALGGGGGRGRSVGSGELFYQGGPGGGGGDGDFRNGNGGRGGKGGNGGNGFSGGNGGRGGDGQGGAIYNTGMLTISDSQFLNNLAQGRDGNSGGDGWPGGSGGDGGSGGRANLSMGALPGMGGDGGDGGDGGNGGDAGDGGSGQGGAIYSTTMPMLTNVTLANNRVGGGSGGVPGCTPGVGTCPGVGRNGGLGGLGGLSGDGRTRGRRGQDGAPGKDGNLGNPGLASDPDIFVENQ